MKINWNKNQFSANKIIKIMKKLLKKKEEEKANLRIMKMN
jgi:hypothetical protein